MSRPCDFLPQSASKNFPRASVRSFGGMLLRSCSSPVALARSLSFRFSLDGESPHGGISSARTNSSLSVFADELTLSIASLSSVDCRKMVGLERARSMAELEDFSPTTEAPPPSIFSSSSSSPSPSLSSSSLSLSSPSSPWSFVSKEGDVYTSIHIGSNGLPVICGANGCRPLVDSDKVSAVHIGLGLGLSGGGQHGGRDNGRNSGSSGGGHSYSHNSGSDADHTEMQYKELLTEDPGNPVLLRNYAQFLGEVRQDQKRAEEYYERAILADPSDSEVLSQYAKLVWNVHKDQDRADAYFNQALQANPDDCYATASYASFLWDSEEDDNLPCDMPHVLDSGRQASLAAIS